MEENDEPSTFFPHVYYQSIWSQACLQDMRPHWGIYPWHLRWSRFVLSICWCRILFQINRNMLFRTPRFIAFGLPSSYSIPQAPPAPDICSSRSRSSASAWDTVLALNGGVWRLLSWFEEFFDTWLLSSCSGSRFRGLWESRSPPRQWMLALRCAFERNRPTLSFWCSECCW